MVKPGVQSSKCADAKLSEYQPILYEDVSNVLKLWSRDVQVGRCEDLER
jgi:hypothetical protein